MRARDCGSGLKMGKDRLENARMLAVYCWKQGSKGGKIPYLFIEARKKTGVLKMEGCKCELF